MIKNLPGSIPICAILLLLTSFVGAVQAESVRDATADPNVPNRTLARMLDHPTKLFKDYHDVIQKLGKPKSENVAKQPNKYDQGTSDMIRTLTYPGLVVVVYQVPKLKKEFIFKLTLTKRPKKFGFPVTLGASRDFAISQLGQPRLEEGDTITYSSELRDLVIQF
jgi:hypothetical protein